MATLTTINSGGVKDDSIVDADIKSSAAIAGSKIDPDFGSQTIETTGGCSIGQNIVVGGTVDGVDIAALNTSVGNKAVLTGSTNNTITTITGANAIQGEANLTFDGDTLDVVGTTRIAGAGAPSTGEGMELYYETDLGTILVYDRQNAHTGVLRFSASNVVVNSHVTTMADTWADDFIIYGAASTGMTIHSADNTSTGSIAFSDATSGGDRYAGFIQYDFDNNRLKLGVGSSTEFTMKVGGQIGIGTTPTDWDTTHWRSIALGSQQGTISSYHPNSPSIFLSTNCHSEGAGWGSTWKQTQQNAAAGFNPTRYYQYGGTHYFERALARNDDNDLSFVEQLKLQPDLDVNVVSGNLKIGTSGKGVQFSPYDEAVSSPGSDSNTLDDYEEGTFTPTISPNSNSFSTAPGYTVQAGEYTKVGNLVTCNIYLGWNSNGAGGSGTLGIFGLPFTMSAAGTYTGVSFGWSSWDHAGVGENNFVTAYGQNGGSYAIFLYQRTANGSSGNNDWQVTYTAMDYSFGHDAGSFSCTISYHV